MFVNSRHFTGFDHSIVVIEFNGLKITTSLEHARAILRDYNGKDRDWRQEYISLFPSDWHENGNGEDTGPSVAEFFALRIAGLDLRFLSRSKKIAKVYVEDEFGRWLMIRKLNYTSFKIPRADEDGKLTSLDVKYLMDGAEIVSERKRIKYAWGLFSKNRKRNKNVIIFIWKWKLSILPKTSN